MEKKVRRQIILLSILLHLLLLALWESSFRLDRSRMPARPIPAPGAPLVFDLAQPDLPREVIATADDARSSTLPEKADFLSDKNAMARNQQPDPQVPLGRAPYAQGDADSHDLPALKTSPKEDSAALQTDEGRSETPAESSRPADGKTIRGEKTPFQPPRPGIQHDFRDTRVAESGGLSFNTYNWDFAPYMLELKERIRGNIFPPLAFSALGMIDGDTLLRFKIFPSGELRDLELLAYQGHRSLMETSTTAIKISAPFRKLPGDFPEPYLQVTAKFTFFIKNKRG